MLPGKILKGDFCRKDFFEVVEKNGFVKVVSGRCSAYSIPNDKRADSRSLGRTNDRRDCIR